MKKFMKRIEENEKISIWGIVDNKNIQIENKKICDIVKCFYQILDKENIDINKAKVINTTKLMIQNEEINPDTTFLIYGYARRKGKADETSMRYYFNIEFMKVSNLLLELKILNKHYLKHYNATNKEFDIIVEYFYIEKERK